VSSVRMCDNCGEIFSEAEERWSTAQQVQIKVDESGQRRHVSLSVDFCPDCSGDTSAVANRLAIQRRERRAQKLELESANVMDEAERTGSKASGKK